MTEPSDLIGYSSGLLGTGVGGVDLLGDLRSGKETMSYEGPRTRVGQLKMKYWKLHKNEVKNVHPIIL